MSELMSEATGRMGAARILGESEPARERSDDSLVAVLSEFARTLVTDFPIEGILDHLVLRIVDLLPIDAAGVSLITPTTRPRIIAGSNESAKRYELLQGEIGEGPCIAAYETEGPISIPDLADDDRFPVYAKHALAEGIRAVFTFPLRNGGRCLGALDLYRTTTGDLDADEMATAQTLADVTTAYLLNAEAKAANAELVTMVSHELRTPVTNITAFVELFQDLEGVSLTNKQEKFIEAIARNSKRLEVLADKLLVSSRLEVGEVAHEHVELDLGAVISAARVSLATMMKGRDIDVVFTTPPDPVMVFGDPIDLETLVVNLVSNALKFTEDGGWVHCTLEETSAGARIEVSDNGLGIREDEKADVFNRFFRSTTARENAIQGTGLGLAIVAAVARNHGGDVSLVSRHLRGSTFTVRLPLALVPA